MKILIRELGLEQYVWKDATYAAKGFLVEGVRDAIAMTNIVSILNDNRNQYVKCAICGEVFRKGSKKWENHIQKTTDTSKCFECRHLRTNSTKKLNSKYVLQDNGKYINTTKTEMELICSRDCSYHNINSEQARECCVYNRCVNAESTPVTDFFTDNKGVFDEIITVDRILKKGYTSRHQGTTYTRYKLKARQTIYAHVNNKNIVDYFRVLHGDRCWTLYYSKKFDKLYSQDSRGRYCEWNPSFHLERSTIENVHKKIAELYD